MNKLPTETRVQILGLMVEGMSIRAIARLTGASKNTVVKFLRDAGEACARYQDEHVRGVACKRIQVDEIWSFVGMKQKNIPAERRGEFGIGDVWTWTAIDADTKLAVTWLMGDRSAATAKEFMLDLASRLTTRPQITSDGHSAYPEAVEEAFGSDVDFAQLQKVYATPIDGQKRYSPPECVGCKREVVAGNPDPEHISTSFAERANLTMRMSMRRFTRLTNAFSKDAENHAHAIAIHFMHYNFARIHQTLRVTPAMAAGVTTKLWELGDMVAMIDEAAPKPSPRGPYKKRQEIFPA
ncbi:MAG: IS1 family transposase [Geminicoccaceae bacterium]